MSGKPYSNFFWSDYQGDPKLRMCGFAARGLWMEILAIMHQSTPRGYLLIEGINPNTAQLASLCGGSVSEVKKLSRELLTAGVPSVDDKGVWYSRRMIRENRKSEINRENGKKGGNPKLTDNQKSQIRLTDSDNRNSSSRLTEVPTDGLSTGLKPIGIGSGTYQEEGSVGRSIPAHGESTQKTCEIGDGNPFGGEDE